MPPRISQLQMSVTVTLDVPILTGLQLDHEAVRRRAAAEVAATIRTKLRAGIQVDGRPMGRGDDGGAPLKDSGRLIRDIKYDKRDQSVRPSTWPRSDLKPSPKRLSSGLVVMRRRVTSSFGLYMVHLVGRMKRGGQIRQLPNIGDALGTTTYWPQHLGEVVQRALQGVPVGVRTNGTRKIRSKR